MTRICLALMFQNEEEWLRLHLPYMAGEFDGIVGLDGGSTDNGAEVIYELGGYVFERNFDWDFGAQANCLLSHVEELGFDAILRLDPDEIMSIADIQRIKWQLTQPKSDLIMIQRHNFIKDRLHWNPLYEPHGQWRAWLLGKGIRYWDVKVHENPKIPDESGLATSISQCVIYHYGALRDPSFVAWRRNNYGRLGQGLEVLPYIPSFADWPAEPILYPYSQPLDPEEIGTRAPFSAYPLNLHLSTDLLGDRDVEYGFIEAMIPQAIPGQAALDVGSGGQMRLAMAARKKGWGVATIDYEEHPEVPGFNRITGDITKTQLNISFGLIICCSTVEHVGINGRYGVSEFDINGDLKAMDAMYEALAPDGILLLTLPVGRDRLHIPMHRVYGDRLSLLLSRYEILTSSYWVKKWGRWVPVPSSEALQFFSVSVSGTDWQGCIYALGCFVLRKLP